MGTRVASSFIASATHTSHRSRFQNDGTTWQVGGMSAIQTSERTSLTGGLYYFWSEFDRSGQTEDFTTPASWLSDVQWEHMLSSRLTYTLSLSRRSNYSFAANRTLIDAVELTASFSGFLKSNLFATARMEWAKDSGGLYADDYRRLFLQLDSKFSTGPRSDLSVYYRLTDKISRDNQRSYVQHQLGLLWEYRF
jgi:hypothetical protein